MKRFLPIIFGVLAIASARAETLTNVFTQQSVNGTNNSSTNTLGAYVPATVYFVENQGLSNTNAATLNAQATLDGSNWFTYATFKHPQTNAGVVDTFTANPNPLTIYRRVQIVTTNAVTISVKQKVD